MPEEAAPASSFKPDDGTLPSAITVLFSDWAEQKAGNKLATPKISGTAAASNDSFRNFSLRSVSGPTAIGGFRLLVAELQRELASEPVLVQWREVSRRG